MITIKVRGMPAPQGSKRHVGHGIMIESSRALPAWREAIRHETQKHDGYCSEGPVTVRIAFYLPRPQAHYGSRKGVRYVKDSAPRRPASKKNDIDKLARAVLDGITDGGALADDGQVVSLHLEKWFATDVFPPGCVIVVAPLTD